MAEQKILTNVGEIYNIDYDISSNFYSIKDTSGTTLSNYIDGNWDAVDPVYVGTILDLSLIHI